ncbi:MAG: helix-turn-helix domain-containing protein [Solirubrobacteraceae bacterium]
MCARRAGWLTPQDHAEHDQTLQAFAVRLREVRERAGLTQEQLDAVVYMQRGTISKMEHGHAAPGLFTLMRLAESLQVDPGTLLDGLPVPKRAGGLERVLGLVETHPGITSSQIAEEMQVPPNYAIRLIRRLVATNAITSEHGGWQAPPNNARSIR